MRITKRISRIIALADEASGYQFKREKDELQKILKAYITEELLPWQQRFPNKLYKEIFKLHGWNYIVKGIKQRLSIIGKWIEKFIYEHSPKGVLQELKAKTPKSKAGNHTALFHQSLTTDLKFGQPEIEFSEIEELSSHPKSLFFGDALELIREAGKSNN